MLRAGIAVQHRLGHGGSNLHTWETRKATNNTHTHTSS
jgi:hypothetical protein